MSAASNLVLISSFLPQFEIGATVKLKSGSPRLTVTATHAQYVEVQWFDACGTARQKIYPAAALVEPKRKK